MGRRKKLINHTDIPQHEIEKIARCILPDIFAYYDSEEGERVCRMESAAGTGSDTRQRYLTHFG